MEIEVHERFRRFVRPGDKYVMSVPRMCSEARRVVGVQVGRAQC